MKAIVADSSAPGPAIPFGQRLVQWMSLFLKYKIDDRGRTAKKGGAGAGLMGIAGKGAHKGHIEMNMGIDATRHDKQPFCVNGGIRLYGEILPDRADGFAFNKNIAGIIIGGGNDPAVFNQQ